MFWLHEEDLPAGVGSEPFCAMHLAYIAVFLILTVCYTVKYKKWDAGSRKTADRILGSAVFFFGLSEYGISAITGHFDLYSLPIHLCSLMFLFVLVHAWTGTSSPASFVGRFRFFLGAVIFFPGIPSTWAALLFPDWLNYPFWNYLSISGFMAHGLVSVYGASVIVKNSEAQDPRGLFLQDLKNSLLFSVAGAVAMYCFDSATGTNYWFMLGPSMDSPFASVYERSGYGGYLTAFLFTVVFAAAIWYGIRYLVLVRRRK